MGFSPVLFLYRSLWEPALLLARILAAANVGPARWRARERLGPGKPERGYPKVWMHAASLGESKGLWAVARALAEAQPKRRFVLTANTSEGLEFLASQVSNRVDAERWITRIAPFDHPRVVRGFLRAHDVRALVLFEIELWPHFILESKRAGAPVFWISAQGTRSARLWRAVLSQIDWIQAQTEGDRRALHALGARAVETGGDLRGLHYLSTQSPRAANPEESTPPWEARAGIALVSFHADELDTITPALRALPPDFPVFILPRKREEWPQFHTALTPLGFALRSEDPRAARQIVDAFGLVAQTLARCRAAVVGGSFAPHGGHNLWEPLQAGVILAIGPHHASQRTLVAGLEAAGLLRVSRQVPDLYALHAAPDPGEACRLFAAAETTRLQGVFTRFAARLTVDSNP
jgi:3-deoxy-D-manno-octulosonic-acid transferase